MKKIKSQCGENGIEYLLQDVIETHGYRQVYEDGAKPGVKIYRKE